jgi:hypothetical protein
MQDRFDRMDSSLHSKRTSTAWEARVSFTLGFEKLYNTAHFGDLSVFAEVEISGIIQAEFLGSVCRQLTIK